MLLRMLQIGWSVPFDIGKRHIELEEVGELILRRCHERVLMELLWPRHGWLVYVGRTGEEVGNPMEGANRRTDM